MSRTYTQVLEDAVKNQSVQIAALVAENEQVKEYNVKLGQKLTEQNDIITSMSSDNRTGTSINKYPTAIEEVEARIKAEA